MIPATLAWVSGGLIGGLGVLAPVWELVPAVAQETPPAATPTPSESVADVQRRLQRLGHYQGPIDGLFGEPTRAAIARFQAQAGLARTGILDPLTQSRLDAAIAPNSIAATPLDSPTPGAEPAPTGSQFNFDLSGDGEEEEQAPPPEGTGTPGEASSPGQNGTEGAPPGEGSPPPEGTPAPAAASRLRLSWPLIAMGLLGLALVLGLGGAALWLLLRPPAAEEGDLPDGEAKLQRDPFGEDPPGKPQGQPYRDPFGEGPIIMPEIMTEKRPEGSSAPHPQPMAEEPRESTPVDSLGTSAPEATLPDSPGAIAPPPETQRLPKVNIVEALIEDLQNPDPTLRRKAIWELGQRGNSQAMQPLLRLMMAADSQERSLILATLSEISSRTLKPLNRALGLALQDENPEVRKNAIRDLTRIYDLMGQVGTLLTHAASDEDLEVRQTAQWAMEQFSRLRLQAAGGDPPDRLPGAPPRDSLPPDRPH